MSKTNTQQKRVLDYMISNHGITRKDALLEIGVANLTAVISDLRKKYNILTETIKCKNRYGEPIKYAKYIYIGELKEKEN